MKQSSTQVSGTFLVPDTYPESDHVRVFCSSLKKCHGDTYSIERMTSNIKLIATRKHFVLVRNLQLFETIKLMTILKFRNCIAFSFRCPLWRRGRGEAALLIEFSILGSRPAKPTIRGSTQSPRESKSQAANRAPTCAQIR